MAAALQAVQPVNQRLSRPPVTLANFAPCVMGLTLIPRNREHDTGWCDWLDAAFFPHTPFFFPRHCLLRGYTT